MRSRRLLHAGLALAIAALLAVVVVGVLTAGPGREDRAYQLEQRLRCPVCKSVSIAASPSDTAAAMRTLVAEQVAAGRSDEQIVDYFRARYGDWVLLDPPARGPTLALWLAPIAAAGIGAVVLVRLRRRPDPGQELTAEQRRRVQDAVEQARPSVADEDPP